MNFTAEQIETLDARALDVYVERMSSYCASYFPAVHAHAGPAKLREAILRGIARAKTYAIVSERDVAKYITLSLMLGLDFDAGHHFPWITETLRRPGATAESRLDDILAQLKALRAEQARLAAPHALSNPAHVAGR